MTNIKDSELINRLNANKKTISIDANVLLILKEVSEVQEFIDRMSTLTYGRDLILIRAGAMTTLTNIFNSTIQTLQSIKLCLEYGNIADAFILLRKYRDDLYFYLYVVVVAENSDIMGYENINKDEENISKWLSNKLDDLNISSILKYIASSTKLRVAIKKYDLKDSFDKIGKNLNNYVHSNGIDFYNRSYSLYNFEEIELIANNFIYQLNYITMTFIFLLTMINGLYIMSYDYIDTLDCGGIPEEGSQYWVAPFILDYINKNSKLLGEDCISYLNKCTRMDI